MDRRSFMKSGFLAAAGCALGASGVAATSFAAEETKKIPFALQVYSVREYASKDLRGTLKEIATETTRKTSANGSTKRACRRLARI